MEIKRKRGIYLVPNLLTTGSMFSGFFSMVATIDGQFVTAATAIIIAGIFDCLDGKAARMTNTTSKFGIEYDSISDVISFGVAPSLLIYSWALHSFARVGWIAAFLFLVCSALRLARFNVQVATVESKRFTGMPTPAAAGMIATTIIFNNHFNNLLGTQKPLLILLMTYMLAFLMVSNITYISFKEFNLKRRKPFSVLVSSVLFLIILAAEPEVTLFGLGIMYTLSGIIMLPVRYFKKSLFPAGEDSIPEKLETTADHDIEDKDILLH